LEILKKRVRAGEGGEQGRHVGFLMIQDGLSRRDRTVFGAGKDEILC